MSKQVFFVVPVAALIALNAFACDDDPPGRGGLVLDAGVEAEAEAPKPECTSARKTLLGPIAAKSTGEVKVVSNDNGVTTIYVDATAGGLNKAKSNPRIYIKLDGTKVDITDEEAYTSTDWDLALRRTDIYTNSGDAGPGKGGGILVQKDFAAVTPEDGTGAQPERFFSGDCAPNIDEASFVATTFTGWYSYDQSTNVPKAKAGISFAVKSADGTLYKVAILSNTGKPDGTTNAASTAYYLLQVSKL